MTYHFRDIQEKGFAHFQSKFESDARFFMMDCLLDYNSRVKIYQENDFWHVKVWLNDVRKTG